MPLGGSGAHVLNSPYYSPKSSRKAGGFIQYAIDKSK